MTKIRINFVALALLVLILGAFFIFGAYGWFLKKQARVLSGMANPRFPYRDYSSVDLEKMWPQDGYASVPTTRAPEETHALFLDNLKKGDLTAAVECCFRKGDWEEMKSGLEKIKQKNELSQMIKDLDTELKPDVVNDSNASYIFPVYDRGTKYAGGISFIKDSNGVWLIKSL